MKYENMVIFKDTLTEDEIESEHKILQDIINKNEGEILEHNIWGKQKLAYPIQKNEYGFYVVNQFNISKDGLKQLQRHYKYNENILRTNLLLKQRS